MTSEMSPADIRACTCGNDGSSSNGWGGNWGEYIILFLILVAFGWGGNGFGGFGGGNGAAQGALTRADLCSEFNFNNVDNALRGIQNGLCDGFYAQNTNMLTGFSQIQNSANQRFAGLNISLITNGYETRMQLISWDISRRSAAVIFRAR